MSKYGTRRGLAGRIVLFCALALLFGAAVFAVRGCVSPKTYLGADFGIEPYISPRDGDGDGVDDQTDILAGARAYLSEKPKYKSKYYSGGWPDDAYGVCTDVVARGLLAAGYDLRELVDADIRGDPAAYGLQKPDRNIDFRRVKNLAVYFEHTAAALTTDTAEIGEWQGGDIVVFPHHIGVVSDRRNKKGVPYLLHHANPAQIRYEEDVLEKLEIVGHYRVG